MTTTPGALTGLPEYVRDERPEAYTMAEPDAHATPPRGTDSRLQGMLTQQEMVMNVLGLSMHALRAAASPGGARW